MSIFFRNFAAKFYEIVIIQTIIAIEENMNSSVFFNIDDDWYPGLKGKVEAYADAHNMQIFALKLPVSDLAESDYSHEGCFMLLTQGHKIAFVIANSIEKDAYLDDVHDIISYLFMKYEYKSILGRYNNWISDLTAILSSDALTDLDGVFALLKCQSKEEVKNADLLISLCTGSINEIKRVGKDVPNDLLRQVKQKIQLFDADQTRFIYQVTDKRVVRIQGLSGTGKTELLLHKLKELYIDSKEYKIYLTCHNRVLAATLRRRIPQFFNYMRVNQQIAWGERLWCSHAWGGNSEEGLYKYLCDFYKINYYPYVYGRTFEIVCKQAVVEINNIKNIQGDKFQYALDYILVDECQDFKENFKNLCELVTKEKVYFAGDIFQTIYDEYKPADYEADIFLTRCYRTDITTLMFAHALGFGLFEKKMLRWLNEADWRACGYTYAEKDNKISLHRESVRGYMGLDENEQSMNYIRFHGKQDMLGKIISLIKSIQKTYPEATINDFCIIFMDLSDEAYEMANLLEMQVYHEFGWLTTKAYLEKRKITDTLLISNRNNIKGLEYPFVICVTSRFNSVYSYRNALYTMLTRSLLQTYLLVDVIDADSESRILHGLDEIKKEHTMTFEKPTEEERRNIETRLSAATSQNMALDELVHKMIVDNDINPEYEGALLALAASKPYRGLSNDELLFKLEEASQSFR